MGNSASSVSFSLCSPTQPDLTSSPVQDLTVLARDIAGDGAQKAANKVNPSEDELNNIDEPAEENTWHESPDFQGMKGKVQSKSPFGNRGEAKEAAKQNAQQSAEQAQQTREQGGSALDNLKNQAKNTASANMSEEDKQKAREKRDATKERTQNYLKEKMPKERREQTIYRLKKMIVEIQGHQDCALFFSECIAGLY